MSEILRSRSYPLAETAVDNTLRFLWWLVGGYVWLVLLVIRRKPSRRTY